MMRFRASENGVAVRLPHEVMVHMVAARYGQSPKQVREWPAQDFIDAINYRMVTGGE